MHGGLDHIILNFTSAAEQQTLAQAGYQAGREHTSNEGHQGLTWILLCSREARRAVCPACCSSSPRAEIMKPKNMTPARGQLRDEGTRNGPGSAGAPHLNPQPSISVCILTGPEA